MDTIPISILSKTPDELSQRDYDIIYQAISNNLSNFNNLHEELKTDPDFLFNIAKQNYNFTNYFPLEMLNNYELMLNILKEYPDKISIVGDDLLNNVDFMREVIQLNPNSIYYASDEIKRNRDFVYETIKLEPSIYNYFIFAYPNDEEMIIEAIQKNPNILNSLNPLWKNNRSVAIALVKNDAQNLDMVSGKFGYDKKVIRQFFNSNYTVELVKRLMSPQIVEMYFEYMHNNGTDDGFGNYLDSIWLKEKINKVSKERMREDASVKIKNSIQSAKERNAPVTKNTVKSNIKSAEKITATTGGRKKI